MNRLSLHQETILKLNYAGFKTKHLHRMYKFDSTFYFLYEKEKFHTFLHKTNFNYKNLLKMYKIFLNLNIDSILQDLNNSNIKIVFYNEERYPYLLKQIYDFPFLLFLQGKLEILSKEKKLGIVGAREATIYTQKICEWLIPHLVKEDITIVSGLAKGADYFAHVNTIDHNGNTIAVCGYGLKHHYPNETIHLNTFMKEKQLVLSEYNPETRPSKWNFPERNRIISGLSQGVLVTEANEKSGSLITVDQALEQNRNVYCCPGTIFDTMSKGVNKRIQEGAKLVANPSDIIEDFGSSLFEVTKFSNF